MSKPPWTHQMTDAQVDAIVALLILASELSIHDRTYDDSMVLTFRIPKSQIATAPAELYEKLLVEMPNTNERVLY